MRSKLLDVAHLLLYTNEASEIDQEADLGAELIEEEPKAEEREEWKKKKNRSVAEGAFIKFLFGSIQRSAKFRSVGLDIDEI